MFISEAGVAIDDGSHVLNGQAFGVGIGLQQSRWEVGLKRPYIDSDGRAYVTVQKGMVTNQKTGKEEPRFVKVSVEDITRARGTFDPVMNAAMLPKNAWIELDRAVVRATRQRLRAWTDLAAASSRGGFNAMSKMTLEYQAMNDPGEAVVDMDGIADGRTDRPLFNLKSIPLPITHSDFWFSEREIAVSRNSGTPLDTTMAEAAGRRVAETIEQTVIGTITGVVFGTQSSGAGAHTGSSAVYGYTNFPYRVTKTDLNTPTGSNPEAIVADILEMRETMRTNGFFGPYLVYHSTGYDRFLDDDYFRSGGTSVTRTLRERIESIEGISGMRRLDYLTSGYQMIMIQMTSEVAQAINGMDITTVQWESQGGMRKNFKVMAIQVPLLKSPYNGVAGILHATTA